MGKRRVKGDILVGAEHLNMSKEEDELRKTNEEEKI
jgi:hypothetical protein